MGWMSLVAALFQLLTELLKVRAEHAANLGVPKLPIDQKRLVDALVVDAVRTRDTSDLVALLKGSPEKTAVGPPAPGSAP